MNRTLCFLIAFLAPLQFQFVGMITAGELLVPLLLLVNIKRCVIGLRESRLSRSFLLFLLVYLFGLIFSDFYRSTPPEDYLRGWAKIILTIAAYLAFLGAFRNNQKNFIFLLYGLTASFIIKIVATGIFPTPSSESYKWTYGIPLTFIVFIYASNNLQKNRLSALTMMFGVGTLSLLMNFRSLAGITYIATVMIVLAHRNETSSMSPKRLMNYMLILAAMGVVVLQGYSWAAPKGLLGQIAQEKFESQSKDGNFSLLSGRSEVLFSLPKIMSSPIIGWGSWAKDYDFVFERSAEMGMNLQKVVIDLDAREGMIPTHSHIFGGWLEAGIVGGLFWILAAWLIFRNMSYIKIQNSKYLVLIYLNGAMILWDLVFSPYGAGRRAEIGAYLAFHVLLAGQIGFTHILQFRHRKMGSSQHLSA